mmetsp:Transcript_31592/g.57429  ORF Transcript_31592/g.57429 Transcript_31592/m.57429 type:complete len:514 (-) Transcript_31592:1280-2821(-)
MAVDRGMSMSKYAERFKLAFSDITPTIEIEADQIEVRDDLKGCEGRANTDGNGLASADFFEKIAIRLGCPGRRISAIQMRLGPAKGMLVCSYELQSKIVLFSEQVKYGKRSYYQGCEICQRTIEVCSSGIVFADHDHRRMQRLNSQVILVLQAIGCPAQVFLDLEARFRDEIASIMLSTAHLVHSDFLPSADVADGHAFSDLCFQIHAMHAAGMDHTTDNYLFLCVRKYIHTQIRSAREDGHLPCPDSYVVTMVSDFMQRLEPGSMSVWLKGRGFLLGRHLATQIPCAHPGDIVLLNAVDDFSKRSPGFAYENLAVMSAHESLPCSPAHRMSGGDYDGDKAFIIGFPEIVNNVHVQERGPSTGDPDPLCGEYRCVKLEHVITESRAQNEAVHHNVEEALKKACVQMVDDAGTMAKINIMWTARADRDISLKGNFSWETKEFLVGHQELALDAAKTGWRITPQMFQALQQRVYAPSPHWFRSGQGPARDDPVRSKSALGQLYDLETPEDWTDEA